MPQDPSIHNTIDSAIDEALDCVQSIHAKIRRRSHEFGDISGRDEDVVYATLTLATVNLLNGMIVEEPNKGRNS